MDPGAQALAALENLEFGRLEAEVYITLLQNGPMSGYRIAQLLNRPDANVYKALTALTERGATLERPGEKKVYKPVPIGEYAARLEDGLRKRTLRAKADVARIREPRSDDWSLYRLPTYEQIAQKVRVLLDTATSSALIDAPARLLTEFREILEQTAARGIVVLAKSYQPIMLTGIEVAFSKSAATVYERWSADWINMIVDGKQAVLALIARDEQRTVLQGIYTESRYLSWVLHCALGSEISLSCLEAWAENDPDRPLAKALAALQPLPTDSGVDSPEVT